MHLHREARALWGVNGLWRWHSAGQWRVHVVRQHYSNNGGGQWRWVDGQGPCVVLRTLLVAAAWCCSAQAKGSTAGPGVILQGEPLNHGGVGQGEC